MTGTNSWVSCGFLQTIYAKAKIQTGLTFVFRCSTFNSSKRFREIGVNRPVFDGISRFNEQTFIKEFKSVTKDKLKIQLKTLLDLFVICVIELLKKKGRFNSGKQILPQESLITQSYTIGSDLTRVILLRMHICTLRFIKRPSYNFCYNIILWGELESIMQLKIIDRISNIAEEEKCASNSVSSKSRILFFCLAKCHY